MKAPGKIAFSGLIVIIAALASGSLILSDRSGKTSSEYEGLAFLKGLTDSVTVYRDERGMPHIYATNDHDMYWRWVTSLPEKGYGRWTLSGEAQQDECLNCSANHISRLIFFPGVFR